MQILFKAVIALAAVAFWGNIVIPAIPISAGCVDSLENITGLPIIGADWVFAESADSTPPPAFKPLPEAPYDSLGFFQYTDHRLIMGTTDKALQITWDASECTPAEDGDDDCADVWDIVLFHVERKQFHEYAVTTETSMIIKLPRTGHYIVFVRGRNNYGFSPWTSSGGPRAALPGGSPGTWIVYGHVGKTGEIIIE